VEKMIPSCPVAVNGEEEEKINPQYQETWYEETLTLKNSIYIDPRSLSPPLRCWRGRQCDQLR
jgi:hypothetical protein